MFLIEELPKIIKINENNYEVRNDFRTWINVEQILNDDNISFQYKPYIMSCSLDLFYGNDDIFDNKLDAILDGILSFWRCNLPINQSNSIVNSSNDVAYDYEEDFYLICAAFKQQYGIDLLKSQMHWFEYKSLFDGLTKETQFIKIVGYRTIDLKKVPKEQRKDYQKLKDFYSIQKNKIRKRTQKEIEAELLSK